ncbi:Uncharacterised protein [Shewanella putrefaciens]|nr:Uncharacterised protein [Shewanella putrefaciens]
MGKGSGHIQHHCLGLITCSTVPKNIPNLPKSALSQH